MICPQCKRNRVENAAPCPYCGTPSPLGGNWSNGSAQHNADASFAEPWHYQVPQVPFDASPPAEQPQWYFTDPSADQTPQLSFDAAPINAPVIQQWSFDAPPASSSPSWSSMQQGNHIENSAVSSAPGEDATQEQGSRQLVPYQPPVFPEGRQTTMSLQLVPQHMVEHLLPALPETPETVYVPPFYTKPRPLIPRYRIFSGLLSILIVATLLCGGSIYFARTHGVFDAVGQFFGGKPLANVQPTMVNLPDPKMDPDLGPAYGVIPSAALTDRVDQQNPNNFQYNNIFKPGQTIYVVCNVTQQADNGYVYFKWYTNKALYRTSPDKPQLVNGGQATVRIVTNMVYYQPAEGSVEIYWRNKGGQDQLAQTLYFVVR